MGYEILPTPRRQQVLVATAAGDMQAIALVLALRAEGLGVIIAETVGLAAYADEVAVCIVVLHPEKWHTTPSITTAMRSNPRYMIPVLAEPMPLPTGAWSTEPIIIEEPLSVTVKKLEDLILTHLEQTLPAGSITLLKQSLDSATQVADHPPYMQSAAKETRRRMIIPYNYLLLLLIVVMGMGLLFYYNKPAPSTTFTTIPIIRNNHSILDKAYTATVPGPNCDTGGANWQIGRYYTDTILPTASATDQKAATPTVQGTTTSQIITDPSIEASCQKNGLRVTHHEHFNTYATILFASAQALPTHFSTQITSTIISGTDTTSIYLGVRNQNRSNAPDANSQHGFGDDVIALSLNGTWQTSRFNDTDGRTEANFTRGFSKVAQSFTLGAEVNGTYITFSINGQKLSTFVDTAYPDSYGIAFGVADPDAKSPPSVLFSNFVYTLLP